MLCSTRGRFGVLVLMLLCLPILSACSFDPETTVTIEITGDMTSDERDELLEELKGMTDTGNHKMQYSSSGTLITVKLSPVSDPEAFAKKIEFGQVTEVTERTVKVAFDSNQ